ncbi:hypothetical protein ACFT0G_32540 [Streptomyces sp. NPDC057020]|uniref:hypothetical protein n=1 Tax=unclassified Streptomyces TaxID=2593676 RepID=UPI003640706F
MAGGSGGWWRSATVTAGGMAVVTGLIVGIVQGLGGDLVDWVFEDDSSTATAGPSPSSALPAPSNGSQSETPDQGGPAGSSSPQPAPSRSTPSAGVVTKNVTLADQWGLALSDQQIRPRSGAGMDFFFGYQPSVLYASTVSSNFTVLPTGTPGTLDACERNTAYRLSVDLEQVPPGGHVCFYRKDGTIALIKIKRLDVNESFQAALTLDITVWLGATAPRP